VLLEVHRWKELNVYFPNSRHFSAYVDAPFWKEFLGKSDEQLPRLRSLAFEFHQFVPQLRRLSPVHGFRNPSSLSLRFGEETDPEELTRFLLSFPALENLELDFYSSPFSRISSIHPKPKFPSIRSLHITIFLHDIQTILSPFTEFLYPNLTNMLLTIDERPTSESEERHSIQLLYVAFEAATCYPSLDHLEVVLQTLDYKTRTFGNEVNTLERREVVLLSISLVPRLEHLRIDSSLNLNATIETLDFDSRTTSPNVHSIPALQTLHLNMNVRFITPWVREWVRKLQAQGDWGKFKELIVPSEDIPKTWAGGALVGSQFIVPKDHVLDYLQILEQQGQGIQKISR